MQAVRVEARTAAVRRVAGARRRKRAGFIGFLLRVRIRERGGGGSMDSPGTAGLECQLIRTINRAGVGAFGQVSAKQVTEKF
ncbi:hypothetical protein MN0502_07660 [Arthrobacter sp. MN05-02]|nr:hypothetical protein MN0502_07660 [Arthrobacter sp. MN05-02]